MFLFKRTIREAALKHGIYATFMAKPMQGQPGSAMHIHQSVIEINTGRNLFSNPDGVCLQGVLHTSSAACSTMCRARLVMMAPYVNSYPPADARYVGAGEYGLGLRQPHDRVPRAGFRTGCAARSRTGCRVRMPTPISRSPPRLPAAISASSKAAIADGTDGRHGQRRLKSICRAGCSRPSPCSSRRRSLAEVLSPEFIAIYAGVKRGEFETFMQVISPWEREFLLLNV